MPYFTLNIGETIEMNGFQTEAEARAYCRKAHYPIFIIFEGTFAVTDEDNYGPPVAIYVRGKGYNPQPIEKDVPYKTFRVIPERLPRADGFEVIITAIGETYWETKRKVAAVLVKGARLLWVIHADYQLVEVYSGADGKKHDWLRETDTLDGGDVVPGFSLPVAELFEELTVE